MSVYLQQVRMVKQHAMIYVSFGMFVETGIYTNGAAIKNIDSKPNSLLG